MKFKIGFSAKGLRGGLRNRGRLTIPQLPETIIIDDKDLSKDQIEVLKADKGIQWFNIIEEKPVEESLLKKTVQQLKKIADEKKIKYADNIKKDDLIVLIEESEKTSAKSDE